MLEVALTGADTIQIGPLGVAKPISAQADQDVGVLRYPNELMAVKTGKNGNAIFAFNATGQTCEVDLRLVRGSKDDRFFLGLLTAMKIDPPSFVLLAGYIVKRIGNGAGASKKDTYLLAGGVFVREVDAISNYEGNTDSGVSVYRLKFANAPRAVF